MKHIPRRKFLFESLGGAAAVGAAAGLAIRASSASPNDQLGVSIIGVGGMGYGHVKRLLLRPDVRFVSLCDIDQARRERAGQTVNRDRRTTPKLQEDFRDVLADPDVDAVVVATPHHWHCPIAIPAMQAGKDVYIEKPASHVFREGRLLVDAARKYDRVVQHGTQMRSSEVTKQADELLKNGVIGEVNLTSPRSTGSISSKSSPTGIRNEKSEVVRGNSIALPSLLVQARLDTALGCHCTFLLVRYVGGVRAYIDYLSGDLDPQMAMVQMDITDIQYPDNSFDVIYCSHVLEHVPDDRKGMS